MRSRVCVSCMYTVSSTIWLAQQQTFCECQNTFFGFFSRAHNRYRKYGVRCDIYTVAKFSSLEIQFVPFDCTNVCLCSCVKCHWKCKFELRHVYPPAVSTVNGNQIRKKANENTWTHRTDWTRDSYAFCGLTIALCATKKNNFNGRIKQKKRCNWFQYENWINFIDPKIIK